ncbi:helix-turn-helix transcriptional regulator [Herbidospora cretacea]|uniref:helix-turn-helix transcriptional regulator n=1 Tax=Herbidospora cretacea TaxID=28444 RepID=UPI0004C3A50A|nr:helix-turn-helix domain-containing protein [Herbidospora cretacea]
MYRERPSAIPGAVVWQTPPASGEGERRILPDGCMDLLWTSGRLVVAGPDSVAYVTRVIPGAGYTGLRFAPGDLPELLGVAACELRDRRVPLDEIWSPRRVRALENRLFRGAPIEALAAGLRPDPMVRAAAGLIGEGRGVAAAAGLLDLGERRFHRLCLRVFGYGPKTLGRILRMNRALEKARKGETFARVAHEEGYADQAHLAREVRALTGVTLTDLAGRTGRR